MWTNDYSSRSINTGKTFSFTNHQFADDDCIIMSANCKSWILLTQLKDTCSSSSRQHQALLAAATAPETECALLAQWVRGCCCCCFLPFFFLPLGNFFSSPCCLCQSFLFDVILLLRTGYVAETCRTVIVSIEVSLTTTRFFSDFLQHPPLGFFLPISLCLQRFDFLGRRSLLDSNVHLWPFFQVGNLFFRNWKTQLASLSSSSSSGT